VKRIGRKRRKKGWVAVGGKKGGFAGKKRRKIERRGGKIRIRRLNGGHPGGKAGDGVQNDAVTRGPRMKNNMEFLNAWGGESGKPQGRTQREKTNA